MNTPDDDGHLDLAHANAAGAVGRIDYVSGTRVIPFHISRQPKPAEMQGFSMGQGNTIYFFDSQDILVRVIAGSLEQWQQQHPWAVPHREQIIAKVVAHLQSTNLPSHVKSSDDSCWIDLIRQESIHQPGTRRVIKTARSLEEINAAAQAGFRPLVKAVKPSSEIRHHYRIWQNVETGEIVQDRSGRVGYCDPWIEVIHNGSYYPYHFPNPFAAYLLPADLVAGEEVWLEDLIEDVPLHHRTGGHARLEAGAAVWNGADFEVILNPVRCQRRWVG